MLAVAGAGSLADAARALKVNHTTLLIGPLAVLGGAAAIVLGQNNATSPVTAPKLGWILLALIGGAVLPVQSAINGLLRSDVGAPFVVGAISFTVATLSVAVVMLLTIVLSGVPRPQLADLRRCPGSAGSARSAAPPARPPSSRRSP